MTIDKDSSHVIFSHERIKMLGEIFRFTLYLPLKLASLFVTAAIAFVMLTALLWRTEVPRFSYPLLREGQVGGLDSHTLSGFLAYAIGLTILSHVVRLIYLVVALILKQRFGFTVDEGDEQHIYANALSLILGLGVVAFWFAIWGRKQGLIDLALPATYVAVVGLTWLDFHFDWYYGIPVLRRLARNRVHTQTGGRDRDDGEQIARIERALISFKDIYGNTELKSRLLHTGQAIVGRRENSVAPRNGILLSGEPGNGKTVFAEALAGELKLPLLKLTHADVASQWVGERTTRIKRAFDQAIRRQPCALFIDEIDSFIPERSSGHSSVKEDTDVVNALLTLLVDIRKHKVLVIAATNHMDRLDSAAVREGRFDFKVEVTPPDMEARIGLLTKGFADNLKGYSADEATINNVAARWNGFSVKRILAVTEELPSYLHGRDSGRQVTFDDFMAALRRVQGRRGSTPESAIPLDQLILSAKSRESLDMLANRLRDPLRIERLGGSLPTGVLFYGPPGTGKTTVCKSLAKEVGWAFLPTSGAELSRNPNGLQKIYDKAKELRPAILFIDEADDLLRNREYSNCTEATNKLLTIMDGAGDRVRDVLIVAATNNPDQIDGALLRGGRFTEKVEFELPQEDQIASHVANWIVKRNLRLGKGLTADRIASDLGQQSIANVEAVLQHAANRAISRATSDEIMLSQADIEAGMSTVLGNL